MGYLKFTGPVEIRANDNDWIDFVYGGTTYAAQLPAGIVMTKALLMAAFKTVVNATVGGGGAITNAPTADASTGICTVTWDGAATIKWGTGTKAALGQSANELFGFAASDTASATSHIGTCPIHGHWAPSRTFTSDTGDRLLTNVSELRTVLNGTASKRLRTGERYTRQINFDLLPAYEIFSASAVSTYQGKDIERLLEMAMRGYPLQHYADRSSGTYSTYYVQSPSNMGDIGLRPNNDLDWYRLELALVRQEV
jgi:hypothetical protein